MECRGLTIQGVTLAQILQEGKVFLAWDCSSRIVPLDSAKEQATSVQVKTVASALSMSVEAGEHSKSSLVDPKLHSVVVQKIEAATSSLAFKVLVAIIKPVTTTSTSIQRRLTI